MKENEKPEELVSVRLDIPKTLHRKIKAHQMRMTGKSGEYQNFAKAQIDLLEKATKSIK